MAINTQELFRQKQVQFGAGSSPARFTSDFLSALSLSVQDLKTRSLVSGAVAPKSIAQNVVLDEKYASYLSRILDYHLYMLGHNPGFEINLAIVGREIAIKDAQLLNYQEDVQQKTLLDLNS
jgi:hypothetical protein